MATRLDTLQSRLQQYLDCETAILEGAQEYYIGSRRMRRADLTEIAEMIKYFEREVTQETSKTAGKGRNRVFGVVPRDL